MSNARLLMIWLGRALANALAGGLAFAVVGAFCGGIAALSIELLESGLSERSFIGFPIGAIVGAFCGIAGIFIYIIPALRAEPGEFWEPFLDLKARVSWGQIWGTTAACTAFITSELVRSLFNQARFSDNIGEDMLLFAFSAPILMIFGAIASAIFKRD